LVASRGRPVQKQFLLVWPPHRPHSPGLDLGAFLTQLVGGGVGGGILTLVAGLIRNERQSAPRLGFPPVWISRRGRSLACLAAPLLAGQHYAPVEVRHPDCHWRQGAANVPPETTLGQIGRRLRCQRCGITAPPPSVSATAQTRHRDTHGLPKLAAAHEPVMAQNCRNIRGSIVGCVPPPGRNSSTMTW
jgi:hypothetical protein